MGILLPPYVGIAANYDAALGRSSLRRASATLRRLIERYGIAFRAAADIGCGTALFAAHVARVWRVPVFAVDRSVAMLRQALRNGSASHVRLLCQDIRDLRLPHRVDLITANFDTVNHVIEPVDLIAMFRRIYHNLDPGGHFVFDCITDRQTSSKPQLRMHRLRSSECDVAQHITWDPLRRLIFIVVTQRWPKLQINTYEKHVERAYPTRDIVRWLRQAGFFIRAVLDAATLRQAHADSRRIVVVARHA